MSATRRDDYERAEKVDHDEQTSVTTPTDARMSTALSDVRESAGHAVTKLEVDELAGIVATVCGKFPDIPRAHVESLVERAFEHLTAGATVTAHLIPLTLNRSLRLMRESVAITSEGRTPPSSTRRHRSSGSC